MTTITVDSGGTARLPEVPLPDVRARLVLAFGDSLYAGHGLARGESLGTQIEGRLRRGGWRVDVVNAGVSGETTAGGRARFPATLDRLARAPDVVMIGLGANDVFRRMPPTQTRANLVAMLDVCRARGLPVVLTGMMVPTFLSPNYAAAYNRIWPDVAADYGAALDPFIMHGIVGQRELLLGDLIHPNARGVAIMADRIAPIVAARLAEG